MNQSTIQFSLQKRSNSRRDYSFHKTFGTTVQFAPEVLMLTRILNQGGSNACTAYTAVAIREWMKQGKQYDPDRQFQAELAVWGDPNAQGGVDLQTQMATGVKTGFFPIGSSTPTDNTAAYFSITPTKSFLNPNGLDMYDSIKSAINLQKCPLSVGVVFYQEWITAPNGVVPHSQKSVLGRHDMKIAGYTTKKRDGSLIDPQGNEYLVIQNSWGEGYGDGGLFYFDRYMADLVFNEGTFYWTDSQDVHYKTLGLVAALLQNLINLLTQLAPGIPRALGIIH